MQLKTLSRAVLVAGLIGVVGGLTGAAQAQLGGDRTTTTTTKKTTTYVLVEEFEEVIVEVEEKIGRKLVAALLVQNVSSDASMDAHLPRFRERLLRELTQANIAVMTPEDVLDGLKKFNRRNAENFRNKVANDVLDPDDVDQKLRTDASALAVAQLMGADIVVVGTIDAYDKLEERQGNLAKDTYYFDTGIKVLDATKGAARRGGSSELSKPVNPKRIRSVDRVLSEMVNDSVKELAVYVGESIQDLAEELEELEGKGNATIGIFATAADLQMPDIRKLNGEWQIAPSTVELAPPVTVEINGVAYGTGPGVITDVPAGVQTVRITSPGFRDIVKRVVIRDGLTLEFALQQDNEARGRWMEQVSFFSNLRRGEKMTEAQVEIAQGYAQKLRQSGFRWNIEYDHKSDIRVDIEERAKRGLVTTPEAMDDVQKEDAKQAAEKAGEPTDQMPGVDQLAELPPLDTANLPSLLSF